MNAAPVAVIFKTTTAERVNFARCFAVVHHADQRYGGEPYVTHLDGVVETLEQFGYDDPDWAAAGYLHDIMEDCDVSFEELSMRFGPVVARRVKSVSGFGATRRERNALIHHNLTHDITTAILKAADRLHNLGSSIGERSVKHGAMYLKEEKAFMELMLACDLPSRMYAALEGAYRAVRNMLAEETGLVAA